MHATLRRADRFEDLLGLADNDTPYVFSSIFSDAGRMARWVSKKKFKLLRQLDPKLREMLGEGERVRFLTFGTGTGFWESYFLGAMAHFMNMRAVVLTDRRILLVQIDWRHRVREQLSQIRYASIDRIKSRAFSTVVRLNDGKKRVFGSVPRADRKFLQNLSAMIGERVEAGEDGLEELCPHCYAVVEGHPPHCATCGGAFKSVRKAWLLSLLFPGFGDLYLGHWKFAVIEIVFTAAVWFTALSPGGEYPLTLVAFVIVAAFMLVFIHIPDAIATRYIARKGIYPAKGGVARSLGEVRRVGMEQAREEVAAG